jgi:hypothetical protein
LDAGLRCRGGNRDHYVIFDHAIMSERPERRLPPPLGMFRQLPDNPMVSKLGKSRTLLEIQRVNVMSAKVLELSARIRCDRSARELREGVLGVLNEIHQHGGNDAFHRAARDLVGSVAALVAHVEGRQRMLDVLDLN